MAASYPSAVKAFATLTDNVDDILAAHQNDRALEITAIETELGTLPKGSDADVKTRLARIDNEFVTGTYTGDAAATNAITGVGFQPTAVMVWRQDAAAASDIDYTVIKTDQDGLYAKRTSDDRYDLDLIISLDADGFTVGDGTGTDNIVNEVGDYTYMAWRS